MECSKAFLAGTNLEFFISFFIHRDSEEYYITRRIIKFFFNQNYYHYYHYYYHQHPAVLFSIVFETALNYIH